MNQEIQLFICKIVLISNLKCPNNYNMIEYIIGDQQIQLKQHQTKNMSNDTQISRLPEYQIRKENQNQQLLDFNQSQSESLQQNYGFEYIDYKIEDQLIEPSFQSELLNCISSTENCDDSQQEYQFDQFNTLVETNFLINLKFMLKHPLNYKISITPL
ncbi:unnamed protein product [Paramecium sonneborni]|uniref:Uncharacterized protein n=1 Tax=Paramecium sonneborni TaxID=65129 RepID=A0A8S1QHL9_9CILI|nr:unnamed protein product [Paramecium sonneborni]